MTSRDASSVRLPDIVLDVVGDRRKRDVLIAGSLAVLAAGLFPRTLSPSMPSVQTLLRTEPEIQGLLVVMAFLASANSIVGGIVGDLFRRPRVLLAGLLVMLGAALGSIAFPSGPGFYVAQLTGVVGSGVVIAFAIGAVALNYEGTARATALGAVYGVYGLGTATAPALALLFGALGPYWPAYAAAAAMTVVAIFAVRRWRPELPGKIPIARGAVIGVGLWGIALLAVITSLLSFGGPGNIVFQLGLIVGGGVLVALLVRRHRRTPSEYQGANIKPRQLSAAVVVGGVVGFTQAIPLLLLPAVFQYVLQYQPPILATIAIAPFAIALVLAGPVAGILLTRFSPRAILLVGTATLGIGAALLGLAFGAFGSGTSYLWLILPLALIGAGFVISTTVRSAIVFAATPSGLPATAAGYNEASVALGTRVGIIASTILVGVVATNSLSKLLAGRPDIDARLAEFQNLVAHLALPEFRAAVAETAIGDRALYAAAYLDGVWITILVSGVIAMIGAVIAWVMVGPGDPLRTVFDMGDEREAKQALAQPA